MPRRWSFLILLMVFSWGCAAGDQVDDVDFGGPGAATGSGGAGGSPSGSGGEATTTTTSGMGGMGGGAGGMGGMDPCAMGCPMDTFDIDDNPLTGECGCEYACEKVSEDDPIDGSFTDDNCDGSDGVVEQCVYVSSSIGTSGGTGTRLDPVDTIAGAIGVASANQVPAVCLSGEVYAESVNVVSGISIYGGFDHLDPDFAFRRSSSVTTTVEAPGTVFLATTIDDETHIEGMTINALAPNNPGESTYGVRLVGGSGHLFVRYDIINAVKGAQGGPGMNGAPQVNPTAPNGNAGTGGCQGQNCGFGGPQTACVEFGGKGGDGGYDSGSGQNGSVGTAGATVGTGASGSSCFGGGNNGSNGGSATVDGTDGSPGGGGSAIGGVMVGAYLPADGGNGQPGQNGKGGSGAGGGGGGDNASGFCNSDKGGGGGSGGCGGLGGDFGRGGQGGGGSFAVFAAAGTITVTDNELTTAGGGNGGDGGDGVAGQLGGTGGPGGGGNDDSGGGGTGGNGSDGGDGGPGGGGGGGPSACLGYGFTVTFTFQSNTSCTAGLPGVGGAAGTNPSNATGAPGANGMAGPTLQIN